MPEVFIHHLFTKQNNIIAPILQIFYFSAPVVQKSSGKQQGLHATCVSEICLVILLCHPTLIFFPHFFLSLSLLSPLTFYHAVKTKPKLKGTEREKSGELMWRFK